MNIVDLFKGIYKLCDCKCGTLIPFLNSINKPARFRLGHNSLKGSKSVLWKNGRVKNGRYWELYMPDYFSSNKKRYVLEHVYFFQEYHKCCMLPWGHVHHIDNNKNNNMPWNLQGLTKAQHTSLTHRKDMNGRRCSDPKCKTPYETYVNPNTGYVLWSRNYDGSILCNRCFKNMKREEARKLKRERNI